MNHADGHPSPFRFLEAGEVLTYFERDEHGVMRGPFTYVVPPTLRMDRVGHVAAQKHMREPAMPGRAMRWES